MRKSLFFVLGGVVMLLVGSVMASDDNGLGIKVREVVFVDSDGVPLPECPFSDASFFIVSRGTVRGDLTGSITTCSNAAPDPVTGFLTLFGLFQIATDEETWTGSFNGRAADEGLTGEFIGRGTDDSTMRGRFTEVEPGTGTFLDQAVIISRSDDDD